MSSSTRTGPRGRRRRRASAVPRHPAGVAAGVLGALALVALMLGVGTAAGDALQAGRAYAGGTRVESSSTGVSFAVPPGWIGRASQDGEHPVLVMGSTTTEGVGLVVVRTGVAPAQLVASLSEAQDLGDGVVLNPTSEPVVDGQRVVARFENALYIGYA